MFRPNWRPLTRLLERIFLMHQHPRNAAARHGIRPVLRQMGGLTPAFLALSFCGVPALATGGDSWPAVAPWLADLTLSPNEIGLAALGVVALLVGYHFAAGKYIREQAGVGEPTVRTELANQPITIQTVAEFLPTPEFRRFEKYVHDREHEILNKVQAVQSGMDERRAEIADMHEKIDAKFSEAIAASNTSASKVHRRIDDLAGTQGQLVGEMKQMNANIALLLEKGMRR